MTELLVCTVFDSVANAYLDPFFAPNEGFAKRIFGNACKQEDHVFYKNPEDFSLFVIGTFSRSNGVLEPVTPYRVMSGSDVV